MLQWIVLILLLAVAALAAWVSLRRRSEEHQEAANRRKRFLIPESNERVPVYDDRGTPRPTEPAVAEDRTPKPGSMNAILRAIQESERAAATDSQPGPSHGPATPLVFRRPRPEPVHLPGPADGKLGRVVSTPDGEMILTTPPFSARASIFSDRQGRYVVELTRRLPPWIVVCPRVRLDALVKPAPPDGRNAADWREWRRRVRWRAVDVLLCDARSWRPVLALEIGRPHLGSDIRTPGGGNDRILEEVFFTVGIPFIRGSGVVSQDWPLVRPYVDEAILTTRDQCVEGDGAETESALSHPPDDAIVGLLDEGLLMDAGDDDGPRASADAAGR